MLADHDVTQCSLKKNQQTSNIYYLLDCYQIRVPLDPINVLYPGLY